MSFIRNNAVFVGFLILAHVCYVCFRNREALQRRKSGADLGAEDNIMALYFVILAEGVLGMLLSVFGYVSRKEMQEARLTDRSQDTRYDIFMHTGTQFIHFNHRGKIGATSATEQPAKSESEKKNQ
ncbi:hypothetical protein AGDE_06980 [Angomonas deanei]|uniref:Membrane magnesium transporter n=1 Tax=Angomonas deanei TaxID=59799 RepID=A0A7G2C5V4_9TRYP|nr:hypothetical protein AGDE_06980 [Angomonas deanei]CAD2214979.1 hypothetical protein, conserved [Angomonas deanei]|eukprot:EPY36304.1 hypothetical protein AGDE_06980 [Angomonas deanei]